MILVKYIRETNLRNLSQGGVLLPAICLRYSRLSLRQETSSLAHGDPVRIFDRRCTLVENMKRDTYTYTYVYTYVRVT